MSPRTVVVIGCALAGPLFFAGCGESAAVPAPPPPTGIPVYEPDAADAGEAEEAAVEASPAPAAALYQGSPLCRASRLTGCYPDDVISAHCLQAENSAAAAASDGGITSTPACHVVSAGLVPQTKCEASTVPGMYASTCAHPEECSPGYECVQGGTCLHYCCAGNSSCTDGQFCDVQPGADSPQTLVPVCVARSLCMLITNEGCSPDQQCAVVRDDGATSCVAVGSAQDGASCEEEHCAVGLVCLGSLGSRVCEKLCSTVGPPYCAKPRTCVATLPLFLTPAVGVCQ